VDLDMRKRGLSQENFTTDSDVVAFLTDKAGLDDVLSPPSDPASYAAISVTQFATDPGGLLESPRLRQLFAELRERFDLIVVNAPPILPVHDAKSLARLADGALLVLRWGRTTPEVARIAVEMFGEGIIGAVVNRVDYRKHARRGYGDAIEHSARLGGEYQRQGDDAIGTTPLLGRWRAAAE
jgi:Mrp family chromosome partitioning ATPase